jgi:hypothetical protein
MASYQAWVPNVSGNLSFTNIQGCGIRGRAFPPATRNHLGDEKNGRLTTLQQRNLSDTLKANLHRKLDKEGEILYLLHASVQNLWTETECLAGSIYTFPVLELTEAEKQLIKKFLNRTIEDYEISDLINGWGGRPGTAEIEFVLFRDGFVSLEMSGDKGEATDSLVFEAFSFLKDLVHTHKFHRHEGDAIVVPYKVDGRDDTRWVIRTLRNIHKSIIFTYRSAKHPREILNAIGKLSYLEAFQNAVLEKKLIENNKLTNIDTLRSSLSTRLECLKDDESRHDGIIQTGLTVSLSILALIFTMLQLLQIPCIKGLTLSGECDRGIYFEVSNNSLEVVKQVLDHWLELGSGVPIVVFILLTVAYYGRINRWINDSMGHGLIGDMFKMVLSFVASDSWATYLAYFFIASFAICCLLLSFVALGMGPLMLRLLH